VNLTGSRHHIKWPAIYTFVHHKYICWKCVETGEFAEKGLEIDEDEESIVEMILNGEFKK